MLPFMFLRLLSRARGHFTLARIDLVALDWLSLAASGHRRAAFVREDGRWRGQWLAP